MKSKAYYHLLQEKKAGLRHQKNKYNKMINQIQFKMNIKNQ